MFSPAIDCFFHIWGFFDPNADDASKHICATVKAVQTCIAPDSAKPTSIFARKVDGPKGE
jgi:hypothetical protein